VVEGTAAGAARPPNLFASPLEPDHWWDCVTHVTENPNKRS